MSNRNENKSTENIKISIMYNFRDGPWGGANQFLKGLRNNLIKKGIYVEDPYEADVILINQYPFNYESIFFPLYKLKKMGKPVVHRMDGAMILTKGNNFFYDKMQYDMNNLFVEGTIFQSRYVQRTNKELGMKTNIFEKIIFNAPDPAIFNRKDKKKMDKSKPVIIMTSWSPAMQKGFKVYHWLDKNLDFNKYVVKFIGHLVDPFENIEHLGTMSSSDLSSELKRSDIYITASQKESCSNSLLEALHTGLPAIALRDGSHPELVGKGGELFDNEEEIPHLVEKIINNYDDYSKNIDLRNIDQVGDEYVKFCQEVSESKKLKKISRISFLKFIIHVYAIKIFVKFRILGFTIKNFLLNKKIDVRG